MTTRTPTLFWPVMMMIVGAGAIFAADDPALRLRTWQRGALFGAGFILVLFGFLLALDAVWARYNVRLWDFNRARAELLRVQLMASAPQRVRVDLVAEDDGQGWFLGEAPVGRDQLIEFGRRVLADKTLSESYWTGRGRPFSRAEWRRLRDWMIEHDLVEWRDPDEPRQGLALTTQGREAVRTFAALADNHLPTTQVRDA